MYDDYTPSPRLQPGTKLALALFGLCAVAGLVMLLIGLAAHRAPGPQEVQTPAPLPRRFYPPGQPPRPAPPSASEETAAAGTAFLGLSAFFLTVLAVALFALFAIVVQVMILVWVVKDARARGADGGVWLVVILLSHLLGLLVYIASRPPGLLLPCRHCGNRRLDCLRLCPICQRED